MAIKATVHAMAALEFTFAKARFGKQFRCVVPTFGERLHLDAARHPILEDVLRRENKRVVPVSFTMDRIKRTLLITGPNTGGKTVTMKTAGLLSLMAQSGIPVPCEEAEFPVLRRFWRILGITNRLRRACLRFRATCGSCG